MFQSFARPFLAPFPSAGVTLPWYLSGGIAAANCIAAWQPKGAASLAASYTNLANPGTYNAAPGVAPTWDVTNGWYADGSAYLTTTIAPPASQTWSVIMRYTKPANPFGYFCGEAQSWVFGIRSIGAPGTFWLYNGNSLSISVGTSGVTCIAGATAYQDGVSAGSIPSGSGVTANFWILASTFNNSTPNGVLSAGNIQALAIYNLILSGAQVLALTTAMNAL